MEDQSNVFILIPLRLWQSPSARVRQQTLGLETTPPGWLAWFFSPNVMVWGWRVKKCRLEGCGVTRGRSRVWRRWKNVCGMSIITVSGCQLGFSPKEKASYCPSPEPSVELPLCNTKVLIRLASRRLWRPLRRGRNSERLSEEPLCLERLLVDAANCHTCVCSCGELV